MKESITTSFKEQTGYDVRTVELVKEENNKYTGYIVLDKDGSKAFIDVLIDGEDENHFMWKVTQPSPTMLSDAIQQSLDSLQY